MRIIYHIAPDAVVILDVFSKKTRATPAETLAIGQKRLAAYLNVASAKERER